MKNNIPPLLTQADSWINKSILFSSSAFDPSTGLQKRLRQLNQWNIDFNIMDWQYWIHDAIGSFFTVDWTTMIYYHVFVWLRDNRRH